MANRYIEGSQVTVTGTYSIGGTVTDPTTVTVSYKNPSGITTAVGGTAASVTNPSTGVYRLDIPVSIPGKWHYQFLGAGTVIALAENFFIVDPKVI